MRGSSPRASRWARTPSAPARPNSPAVGSAASSPMVRIPQRASRVARCSESVRSESGAVASEAASPLGLDDVDARAEAGGGQRAEAARRDAHANREPHREGGVTEPLGQPGLVAEEALEPRGVEIDATGARVFHPGRVREGHLKEGAVSLELVRQK